MSFLPQEVVRQSVVQSCIDQDGVGTFVVPDQS
jgi:hypothetical protein